MALPADSADAVLTVTQVGCHLHRTPLLRPFVTAQRRTESVDHVVAEVVLERPAHVRRGQGSAAETVAVTGESAASIRAAIEGPIRAALQGRTGTITELAALIAGALPGATSAKAAVDVALHDAWARGAREGAGAPLAELLGAPVGTAAGFSIENDMTISLEEPAMMARRAREAAQAGARILKIKLGRDAETDRRRLAAVLEAMPEARLRLDANQGWDAAEAIRIITRLEAEGLPVDLVEQPVPAADLAGMRAVREAVATPIMADESVWTARDAARIIEAGAADLLNIKLAKTGGLRGALAIADAAAAAGLECMIGAMMEPRLSITAAAHLAAAHPAITMIDLDSPAWFAVDLPRGGYAERDGRLHLLGGPGLGLEPMPAEETQPVGPGTAPGTRAVAAVSAATLWTEPGLNRPGIDDPAVAAPVDLDAWNANMPGTPEREWLTGRLETQALLGAEMIVDEVRTEGLAEPWARVVVTAQRTPRDPRGYPGWVPARQLVVDPAFLAAREGGRMALVTADRTRSADGTGPVIALGTELPLREADGGADTVPVLLPGAGPALLPAGDVIVLDPERPRPVPDVEQVIATGERFLGLRYLWAGMSSFGFDCSGFAGGIYRLHGIDLPRDAGPQRDDSGLPRVAREDLRRGDLVFFATEPGGEEIRHVAVYVGDGMIMQAPNAAGSVETVSLEAYDRAGEYAGAVRVISA